MHARLTHARSLAQVPKKNDIVIIFDADMKAHPNFLRHVLPYLEEDERTALVQTPQHFFNVDHTGDARRRRL